MESLGFLTLTAGTPLQISTRDISVEQVTFQAVAANAGIVFVGLKGLSTSTGAGVLRMIPKPVSTTTGPLTAETITSYDVPGGIHLSSLYVDGTTNDKVLVSFRRG